MISIDTTNLPENIQKAYQNFEHRKTDYAQLQDRLEQLHQRLDKHRKSAEATKIQADQLDAQWRDAFRQNDGELTKEIRAMKSGAQEARDFCLEYSNLADALEPEFELCQLEASVARIKYLESLEHIKHIYTDYNFTKSADELFSLPQAKPFLESLHHKFKEIDNEMKTNELYTHIPDDDTVSQIQIGKEGKLIKLAIQKFINESTKIDSTENSIFSITEIKKKGYEISEINLLALGRRRSELKSRIKPF